MLTTHRSVFEGVYTLAKFYLSRSPDGKMNCISRTLGKFSIVDREFGGSINDQDIWICKIIKEIHPRKNIGAFVLRPIERIDADHIKKIIPGFYDVQIMEHAVHIIPNTDPHDFWMLSKTTRKIFSKKYYAVIVPLAYKEKIKDEEIKAKYNVEKPQMLAGQKHFEPYQARVKATGEVIRIIRISDINNQENDVEFRDVYANKVYDIQDLELVKIYADSDNLSISAAVADARFKATAFFS